MTLSKFAAEEAAEVGNRQERLFLYKQELQFYQDRQKIREPERESILPDLPSEKKEAGKFNNALGYAEAKLILPTLCLLGKASNSNSQSLNTFPSWASVKQKMIQTDQLPVEQAKNQSHDPILLDLKV